MDNHPRACLLYDPSHFVLAQLDYITYIDYYHERIRAFHVKDAEFNKTGKQGTFGGYQSWLKRAGRYRSPGDGQVDFKTIFSKLTQYGYKGWGGNGMGVRAETTPRGRCEGKERCLSKTTSFA